MVIPLSKKSAMGKLYTPFFACSPSAPGFGSDVDADEADTSSCIDWSLELYFLGRDSGGTRPARR